jgi:hypothetical protein
MTELVGGEWSATRVCILPHPKKLYGTLDALVGDQTQIFQVTQPIT